MNQNKDSQHRDSLLSPRQMRAKSWRRRFVPSKPLALKIVFGLITVTILSGQAWAFYTWGKRAGMSQSKAAPTAASAGAVNRNSPSAKRWSKTGTLISATEKEIKIKTKAGDVATISINSNTAITKSGGEKVSVKDINRDTTVISSGTIDDAGKLIAQRLRSL